MTLRKEFKKLNKKRKSGGGGSLAYYIDTFLLSIFVEFETWKQIYLNRE